MSKIMFFVLYVQIQLGNYRTNLNKTQAWISWKIGLAFTKCQTNRNTLLFINICITVKNCIFLQFPSWLKYNQSRRDLQHIEFKIVIRCDHQKDCLNIFLETQGETLKLDIDIIKLHDNLLKRQTSDFKKALLRILRKSNKSFIEQFNPISRFNYSKIFWEFSSEIRNKNSLY